MVNATAEKFTNEEMLERAFHRIAWNVRHMWEETGHSDTRLFIEPIIPDAFVIVGKSISGGEHRDHVVPRVFLCHKCHSMYEQGATVEDVAQVIRKFLKVVLISKEEKNILDKKENLNLKERMPDGWTFESGSPFERLHIANIEFELFNTKASTV